MVAGGFIAGIAFICSGILEYELERTYPKLPSKHEAFVNIINALPCDVTVLDQSGNYGTFATGEIATLENIPIANNHTSHRIMIKAPIECGDVRLEDPKVELTVPVEEKKIRTVLAGAKKSRLTGYISEVEDLQKTLSGKPKLRLIFMRASEEDMGTVSINVDNGLGFRDVYFVPVTPLGVSAYLELLPGTYSYYVTYGDSPEKKFEGTMTLELGGVYSLVLREYDTKIVFAKLYALTPPNRIHMFWIIPQYIFLSVAEVMFAISGLEFSFTQAPKSMKTVTMAAWYFSIACGNLIIIIITQAQLFRNQAEEFFLFAGLIFLDMLIFAYMSSDYQTVSIESDDSSMTFVDRDENYPLLGMSSHDAVLP